MVLSLWRRDRNRMNSCRVSIMEVPESPIASGARSPWQQHRCANPGFVYGNDFSKKVVTFHSVPVQQGLWDCIAVPLLHLGNFLSNPTHYKFAVTHSVVQNEENSFVTYSDSCCYLMLSLSAINNLQGSKELNCVLLHMESSYMEVVLNGIPALTEHLNPSWHSAIRQRCIATRFTQSQNYSFVLRSRTTSILIQGRCLSFVNMVLGRLHNPMKVNVLHTTVDWLRTVAAGCTNLSNSPCSCPQSWQLSNSSLSCDSSVASTLSNLCMFYTKSYAELFTVLPISLSILVNASILHKIWLRLHLLCTILSCDAKRERKKRFISRKEF